MKPHTLRGETRSTDCRRAKPSKASRAAAAPLDACRTFRMDAFWAAAALALELSAIILTFGGNYSKWFRLESGCFRFGIMTAHLKFLTRRSRSSI